MLEASFGPDAKEIFDQVRGVRIVACGTSYHAGLVARHWFEGLAGVPCSVEQASEFRYRDPVVEPGTLMVALSQSGETADTTGALREAKRRGFGPSLGIVNVPNSSLVRDADLVLMTNAGPEIGVASTKAFTTQLVALLLLVAVLGRRHRMAPDMEARIVAELEALPGWCRKVLLLDSAIKKTAGEFADKRHALFLGRGGYYPVAMEGALKLKEISYIHAEAYPAGELKHGPLALVDGDMPVVAVSPNDQLRGKLLSNLEEVRARGGILHVFGEGLDGRLGRCAGDLAARGRNRRRPGSVYDRIAIARLSRRGAQGHGRRSAAQSRQVGHGGIGRFTRRVRPAGARPLRRRARRISRSRPRASLSPMRAAEVRCPR